MDEAMVKKKAQVARLSVVSNTVLVLGKLIVGILIGSVSVISEAIHSGIDLVAAVIAFFAVKMANKPADEEHPYGHGKFENISGTVEAVLIFLAAGLIIYEAIEKLMGKGTKIEVGLGLVIMAISVLVNIYVSRRLMKVAKETDSVALEADALHLSADVYTSLGIFVGLILIKLTGYPIIDPIAAILVALFIIKEAWHMTKNAAGGLIDISLSPAEMQKVTEIIQAQKPHVIEFHKLRTRKAGSERHIDLHLVVASNLSVRESHDICNQLEDDIRKLFANTTVVIHVEPCSDNCKQCSATGCQRDNM